MRNIIESKPDDFIGAIRSGPPWIQAEDAKGQIVRLFPNDAQIRQIHGVLSEYLMALVETEPVAEWPKYFKSNSTTWCYFDEKNGVYLGKDRVWDVTGNIFKMTSYFYQQLTPAEFAALGLPPIPENSNG